MTLQLQILKLLETKGLSGEQRSRLMMELEALEDEEDEYHEEAYTQQPMRGLADMERTLTFGAVNAQDYFTDSTKRAGYFGDQMDKVDKLEMVLREKAHQARAVRRMYDVTAGKVNKASDALRKASEARPAAIQYAVRPVALPMWSSQAPRNAPLVQLVPPALLVPPQQRQVHAQAQGFVVPPQPRQVHAQAQGIQSPRQK